MRRILCNAPGEFEMEMIKWCMKLKNGIELAEPNDNLSGAYVKKAETALSAASALKGNKEWD